MIKVAHCTNLYFVYAEYLLSIWESGISLTVVSYAGTMCLHDPPPDKIPGLLGWREHPGRQHLTHVTLIAGGIKHVLCNPTERGLSEGRTSFHHTWPHAFSFADFIFYYFAVIKLCHGYNYTLSLWVLPVNQWIWEWSREPLTQVPNEGQFRIFSH